MPVSRHPRQQTRLCRWMRRRQKWKFFNQAGIVLIPLPLPLRPEGRFPCDLAVLICAIRLSFKLNLNIPVIGNGSFWDRDHILGGLPEGRVGITGRPGDDEIAGPRVDGAAIRGNHAASANSNTQPFVSTGLPAESRAAGSGVQLISPPRSCLLQTRPPAAGVTVEI